MVNTGEQTILEKRKVTEKDFQEIDKRIVREMLNLSKTGVEEVREKVKLSEGEIYLIMHPDTLGTYDQGEEVNKLNNKKYEEEFLKWFTTILDQNKKSLELGNDHVQPVFLMLEETRIETMRDLLEKIFGNHLSKYGLVMIPTKVNSGTISNEIKDYGHRVMKDFGFEVSDPDGRVFAYNLLFNILRLLGVKKVNLAGGFIGEQSPDFKELFGRCLGILLSALGYYKKSDGQPMFDFVATPNILYKDGVTPETLKQAGYNVQD